MGCRHSNVTSIEILSEIEEVMLLTITLQMLIDAIKNYRDLIFQTLIVIIHEFVKSENEFLNNK